MRSKVSNSVFLLTFACTAIVVVSADLGPVTAGPKQHVDRSSEGGRGLTARQPGHAQITALRVLRENAPGASVSWNSERGSAAFIRLGRGLPIGPGRTPGEALETLVAGNCDLFRTCESPIEFSTDSLQRRGANGTVRVMLKQMVDGRELFRGEIGGTINAKGRFVGIVANVIPGLTSGPAPRFEAAELVDLAVEYLDASSLQPTLRIENRPVSFALDGVARPAELVRVRGTGDFNYMVIVDAADGSLLFRSHVVFYVKKNNGAGDPPPPPTGTVFERAPNDLQGASSDPPVQPTEVPFDLSWFTDGNVGELSGPNVPLVKYVGCRNTSSCFTATPSPTSLDGQYSFTWSRDYTDCSNTLVNQHCYNNSNKELCKVTYRLLYCHQTGEDPQLAMTNLFYHANFLHDLLVGWGAEVSPTNLTSAGPGVGGSICNAHFLPGTGAAPGEIQVGFATTACDPVSGTKPNDVDLSMDNDVIYHEYGHALTVGIVGEQNMLTSHFPAGLLGEGWSDFLAVQALSTTDAPADEISPGTRYDALGEYEVDGGIRRQPMAVGNGVGFEDLCNEGCGVHRDGEIWAHMLFDLRQRLIDAEGFQTGRDTMGQLFVEGMKSLAGGGPPDMITARDGIVLADETLFDGAYCTDIWEAFAGRGLGPGAAFGNAEKTTAVADHGPLPDVDNNGIPDVCLEPAGGGGGGGGGAPGGSIRPKH